MYRSLLVIIALVTLVVDNTAQRTLSIFQRSSARGEQVLQQGAIRVNEAVVRSVVRTRERAVNFTLPMPDGADLTLNLVRTNVVAPGARLTVMTDNGPVHSALGASLLWYKASLPDGGLAVFTFSERGEVAGMVNTSGVRYIVGKQFRDVEHGSYVVMRDHDAPYTCGTPVEIASAQLDKLVSEAHRAVKDGGENTQADDTVTIELAVEADYDLRQGLESNERTTTYITQLVAVMSMVYERELGVKFVISNVRIWDTPNDPYAEDAEVFTLLETFVSEYRQNMTSVARDLAIFLTSRGGQGGIARTIGGVCQEDGSYCAGDVLRYVNNYPTWSWDVGMMAHEIGHVCGGIHTQSCYWPEGPLDSCVASESGLCVSQDQTAPTRGTIMSYCHQQTQNGAVMSLEFHPMHRSVLKSFIRSAACLGNAPQPQNNTLTGVVKDAVTLQPIAGVRLLIKPIIDDTYRQSPPTTGDTSVTSDGSGRYTFSGLGLGLYEVVVPPPYTKFPISMASQTVATGVMIADTLTEFNLMLVKGRSVNLVINNDGDTTPVTLNLFSELLDGVFTYVPLPQPVSGSSSIVIQQTLPLGRYIVVPSAIGRKFTPNKVVVDLTDSNEPLTVQVASVSTLPNLTTSVALGVAEWDAAAVPTRTILTGGMPYIVTNTSNGGTVATGTVPEDGVAVIEDIDASNYYSIQPTIDTMLKAPYREDAYIYPGFGVNGALYVQQPRRMPLLAREYNMSALVTDFVPLEDPIVLRDKAMATDRTSTVVLPFPLQISDRTLTRMDVANNGFVAFDSERLESWVTNPLARYENASLIISAFSGYLNPDTTAPTPWRIAWKVLGDAPNRIIAVEWRNFKIRKFNWQTGQATDIGRFSFQIHIHEGGRIDMVYDQAGEISESVVAQVGLRGNDILDNQGVFSLAEDDLEDVRAAYIPGGYSQISMLTAEGMVKGLTYRWEIGSTTVDEDELSEIVVSPNPSRDVITVGGVDGETTVRIVDMLGSVVLTKQLSSDAARIDVRSLATGRYVLLVTAAGGLRSIPLVIGR